MGCLGTGIIPCFIPQRDCCKLKSVERLSTLPTLSRTGETTVRGLGTSQGGVSKGVNYRYDDYGEGKPDVQGQTSVATTADHQEVELVVEEYMSVRPAEGLAPLLPQRVTLTSPGSLRLSLTDALRPSS